MRRAYPRDEPDPRPAWGGHSTRRGGAATLPLTVFGLAVVEIWAAVPAGLALGLPPLVIWSAATAGAVASVVVVASAGDALRGWILARRHGSLPSSGRLFSLWLRYGVVGWGLLSPLVFAPPMGTAIAIGLGAPRHRLIVWMSAGVALWTTILVLAGAAGLRLLAGAR